MRNIKIVDILLCFIGMYGPQISSATSSAAVQVAPTNNAINTQLIANQLSPSTDLFMSPMHMLTALTFIIYT